MKRKARFTFEQHRAAGRDLCSAREVLVNLQCRLSNCYGKTKPVAHKAQDAVRAVDALRYLLDEIVLHEHPHDDAVLRFYLGTPAADDPGAQGDEHGNHVGGDDRYDDESINGG